MSSFKTCLIKDSRIADITAEETYGVMSGGSQVTQTQILATSQSTSSLVFQVQVPSENIVIDRNVMIRGTVNFQINISGVASNLPNPIPALPAPYTGGVLPVGELAFDLGKKDSFQAFPINSLFTTSSVTINNTNISSNTQDILPALLRMNSARELYRFNSTTTSLPDQQWGLYADGVESTNNPLGGFANNGLDEDFDPRGSWGNVTIVSVVHTFTGGSDGSLVSLGQGATESWVITLQASFCEPLIALSPFIFSDPEYNTQGLLGVNNMSFVFNINAQASRLWSTANYIPPAVIAGAIPGYNKLCPWITSVVLGTPAVPQCWQNTQLLFNYLSLQPSDNVQSRNVVPFMDFPRYLTTFTNSVDGWDRASINTIPSQTFTSTTVQLNQVPDLIFVFARVPFSQQGPAYANSFFPITNITVNFNNQSGILSSATAQDLWKMSRKNGSQQSWTEWQGYSVVRDATGKGAYVPTIGSMLVLSPTLDFGLPNYLSAGSLGNYNLQLNLVIQNTYNFSCTPELVIITLNSGIMTTQQGISNLYTGILTKEMVLEANEKQSVNPISKIEYERMVGGKMHNRALTAVHKIHKKHHRHHAHHMGGEMSGGAESGGAMHHATHSHHATHAHHKMGKHKLASLLK